MAGNIAGPKDLYQILILERNIFIRDALRRILQDRFADVIIIDMLSVEKCETEIDELVPDILFIGNAEKSGEELEQLQLLREKFPATTIIYFMEYDIDEYRNRAIMDGANYVISKQLWTGNEILALIKTILRMKNYPDRVGYEDRLIEESILEHPLERRKKDRRGEALEKEFLLHNLNRRT